ncbi:U-scoloptoxin(16)-Sm1a-like [Parasteatoda tepidariorum]|uniref:U-scoloptoxin(16)-Sm1a-like n=1 Tax=Parasteatoda tepidariorum TaxID=114398 RepID=UPI00077FC5B5|nr:venom toxin OcyC11-like [Parasteatoda tepidariorum]XP_015924704.1 venom toxin OcyC11-like [Parasteatoda tepidariorum]XP_015924705.1 venom toxin OcyC11-like [Parasteatoda tepidariorum]
MDVKTILIVCIGLALMIVESGAATFNQPMDTSSGYCFTDKYGVLKLGEDGYDNKNCNRVTCHKSGLIGATCEAVKPLGKCKVISRLGPDRYYPNCCPTLACPIP